MYSTHDGQDKLSFDAAPIASSTISIDSHSDWSSESDFEYASKYDQSSESENESEPSLPYLLIDDDVFQGKQSLNSPLIIGDDVFQGKQSPSLFHVPSLDSPLIIDDDAITDYISHLPPLSPLPLQMASPPLSPTSPFRYNYVNDPCPAAFVLDFSDRDDELLDFDGLLSLPDLPAQSPLPDLPAQSPAMSPAPQSLAILPVQSFAMSPAPSVLPISLALPDFLTRTDGHVIHYNLALNGLQGLEIPLLERSLSHTSALHLPMPFSNPSPNFSIATSTRNSKRASEEQQNPTGSKKPKN